MRRRGYLVACLLLVAACTSTSSVPTNQFEVTAPTFAEELPATTTIPNVATTEPWIGPGSTRGALPDGTTFDVYLDPPRVANLNRISAGIIIDLDDGTSPTAGGLFFSRGPIEATRWDGTTFQIRTGADSVDLVVNEDVIDALGPEYENVFQEGINGAMVAGYPVLELTPPFRWAADDEVPLQMEVVFDTFVVRRGCGDRAAACSPTHVAQVIPSASILSPGPPWVDGQEVWIDSSGSRPITDPWFFDPGPLGPRVVHDLIWTGAEMIVWGGALNDVPPHLVEGAAFDPTMNQWRMLPAPPIEPSQATRAAWYEGEMIVMSPEATVAYAPASNDWRAVGSGFHPAWYPTMTVVARGLIYTWTRESLIEMDPGSGSWHELPPPGFGGFDPWSGGLVVLDDVVHAVGNGEGVCQGRLISRWTGDSWDPLPTVSLATDDMSDCTSPNQTAAIDGRLIVWGDRSTPAFAYDTEEGSWQEIESTTLSGTEGPLGPVDIGDRLLVPQYREASIFHPASGTWTATTMPGAGEDTQMVWTGEEVLTWGACCYGAGPDSSPSPDAWRWAPPAP